MTLSGRAGFRRRPDSGVDEGAESLARNNAADVAGVLEAEDQDREIALHAHGEGGQVHHAELALDCLVERERVVAFRRRILVGICGVDAVDLGCLEQDVNSLLAKLEIHMLC